MFQTFANFSERITLVLHQELKNVRLSYNFANILNKWTRPVFLSNGCERIFLKILRSFMGKRYSQTSEYADTYGSDQNCPLFGAVRFSEVSSKFSNFKLFTFFFGLLRYINIFWQQLWRNKLYKNTFKS